MKFTTAAVLGLSAFNGVQAFQPISVRTLSTTSSRTQLHSTQAGMSKKKEDRLNFMKSEQFHRRGFKEVRKQVEDTIQDQFQSELVDDLKSSNYVLEKDGVKVYLAKVCKFS